MQDLDEFMDQFVENQGEKMKDHLMKKGLMAPDEADEIIWHQGIEAYEAATLKAHRDSLGFGSW